MPLSATPTLARSTVSTAATEAIHERRGLVDNSWQRGMAVKRNLTRRTAWQALQASITIRPLQVFRRAPATVRGAGSASPRRGDARQCGNPTASIHRDRRHITGEALQEHAGRKVIISEDTFRGWRTGIAGTSVAWKS
jgi:hypothetical protein